MVAQLAQSLIQYVKKHDLQVLREQSHMNIFVISLTKATQRRASCIEQLNEAELEFSFFDAQSVINDYTDFFEKYDEREFQINTGRTAAKGEIGCYASHLALWEKCVELDEPIMIMEDDFYLTEGFRSAVFIVADEIDQYGYIRLQSEGSGKSRLVKSIGDYKLLYYTKMPHSLMCYAITPSVAKQFIRKAKVLDAPVDVMIKKIWEHKQRLYGLSPYTVIDSDLSSESMISGRVKHKKSLSIQFSRFLRKTSWIVNRVTFTAFFTPPKN